MRVCDPKRRRLPDLLKRGPGGPGGEDLEDWPEEEWEQLLSQAARHGLQPLLYRRVREHGLTPFVPGNVLDRLHETFLRSAAQSVLSFHHLSDILKEFTSGGIPVIVLKGSYLAEHVYEDPALRPMCDIDLLVRKDDLPRAAGALERIHWAPSRPFDIEAECSVIHHLPLFSKEGAPGVELHWSLTRPGSPFSLDLEGIWRRSVTMRWGDDEALALAPEDLVLYLGIHAAYQHRFAFGLRPLCDMGEILSLFREDLDWSAIEDRARQWRAGRCLALTLRLAGEMVGADFPGSLPGSLGVGYADPALMQIAREQVLTAEEITPGLSYNLARLWGRGSFLQKASLLRESLFPSRKFLSTIYPVHPGSPRILLCYPLRWKDLVLHYGPTALRLLFGAGAERVVAGREEEVNLLLDWLAGKERG